MNINLKKVDWRPAAAVYGALSVILFFAFFYSAFNNNFPVDHNPAVPGNSNFPESYTISISPALAFAYTWGLGRVLGLIVWLAVAAYMVLVSNYLLGKQPGSIGSWAAKNFNLVTGALMLISVVLIFASSSNVVAGNNTAIVDPERYERIKDNEDSLKALFPKNEIER